VNLLFTATDPDGIAQPITTTPNLARNSQSRSGGANIMVLFGTGLYLQETDVENDDVQTVYAVHDRGVANLSRTGEVTIGTGATAVTINQFEERSLLESTLNGLSLRQVQSDVLDNTGTAAVINYASQFGWFMDLTSGTTVDTAAENGERVVYDGFIANNLFVFNTLEPDDTACQGGSTGWTMIVDWTSGLSPDQSTFDANGLDGITDADKGYVGYKNLKAGSQIGRAGNSIIGSSGDDVKTVKTNFGNLISGRRMSWEEKFPFGIVK
jgi:type IV pilus assembly protein PilY1